MMQKQFNSQQGGTLLGIIIGLVIGLAIALGVALTITKSQIPFLNKSARPERAANAGSTSDPNQPLYGNKAASRQVPKDPAPAVTVDQKPANTANLPPVPAIEPEKKIDAAEPQADTKAEATDEKWNYFLQAGAFREANDAEATRAKLALLGVEAKISERQSDNGVLYRVRVGPFDQLEAMNRTRAKLSESGIDAAIVRISK